MLELISLRAKPSPEEQTRVRILAWSAPLRGLNLPLVTVLVERAMGNKKEVLFWLERMPF